MPSEGFDDPVAARAEAGSFEGLTFNDSMTPGLLLGLTPPGVVHLVSVVSLSRPAATSAIGRYPEWSLAGARQRPREVVADSGRDVDAALAKRRARQEGHGDSLRRGDVAELCERSLSHDEPARVVVSADEVAVHVVAGYPQGRRVDPVDRLAVSYNRKRADPACESDRAFADKRSRAGIVVFYLCSISSALWGPCHRKPPRTDRPPLPPAAARRVSPARRSCTRRDRAGPRRASVNAGRAA